MTQDLSSTLTRGMIQSLFHIPMRDEWRFELAVPELFLVLEPEAEAVESSMMSNHLPMASS